MGFRSISGITAIPAHAFAGLARGSTPPLPLPPTSARCLAKLPAELAFLIPFGIAPAVLLSAAALAHRQAIGPEAALLASGSICEIFFYRCLAHHLGATFLDGEAALSADARYPHSLHVGLAPLQGGHGPRWLAAPRGKILTQLLARAENGEDLGADLLITTPSHLSRLLRADATPLILREASFGLANLDPSLSAKGGPSWAQCAGAIMAIAAGTFAFGLAPAPTLNFVSLAMTCLFLASIWLRLFAGAASTTGKQDTRLRTPVEDSRLPVYSIVVALHREARVMLQLITALDAIDYPGIMAQTPQAV